MTGWIVTRRTAAGVRYDARYRISPGVIRGKTFTTKRGADHYLVTMVQRVHDGSYVAVQPTLMADVFDQWLTHGLTVRVQEGSLKRSTATAYRSMVAEHLRPAFGKVRSDRLTLGLIETWRAGVAAQIAAGTLSAKTYTNLRNLLHAIVVWSQHPARRYLGHDPLAGLPKMRLPRTKTRPHYEPDQVAHLLALAKTQPPDDTILTVVVLSGLRRGEVFGLQWPDVETGDGQTGGCLHVRRRIYQGDVDDPKTPESARVVDVPQRLLDELAVYRVMHPPIGVGYIFRTGHGAPLDGDNWHKRHLVPLLERAGLRLPKSGLHALRHSYVSLLADQGEDVHYIARQVGHSTTALTQDIYRHTFARARTAAMRRLDQALPYSSHIAEQARTTGTGETMQEDDA